MDELAHLRAERERNRFARGIRHAALNATPAELVDIDKLVQLVRAGQLTTLAGCDIVADLRRAQNQRRAA